MTLRTLAVAAMLILTGGVAAQAVAPQPQDFPAEAFTGRKAPVALLSTKDRGYRTRLRDASMQRPNFAGHYVLTTWGCGTSCSMGAAIDVRTGRVIWLPGAVSGDRPEDTVAYDNPVISSVGSRLLVLSGQINETGFEGDHYFLIEGDRFVHLVDLPYRKS